MTSTTSTTNLLEFLPVAVYTTDAEGRITFYNQAAVDLWGRRPEFGSARWCGSWRIYWPDGRPLPHDQCPMAICLKEGRAVRGVEAVAERPDGTRVPFLPYPTPLNDASGRVVGAINLLVDITEHKRADRNAARLAAIVASSDDAIISKSLDGRITSWNEGATRIFGYAAAEMIGQPITRIIPTELHGEEQRILENLRRGERVDHYETVRITKDGRRVDISLSVSPVRDSSGVIIGASKVARDITERKHAEQLQQLLINELHHRVKNTLATVQAIAGQSLLRARSPADFVSGFTGRIHALAKAHTLLTQASMQGADVPEVVREQVMLGTSDDHRISCSGPLLTLEPDAALHLSLILHELATNARKYGALSVPEGRLAIRWEVRTNGGRNLLLRWQESDGPQVRAPATRGFGTTLIEQTLATHGGSASVQYNGDGVTYELRLPIPHDARLTAAARRPIRVAIESSPSGPGSSRSTLAGKRILVIEDEPLVSMDVEASLAAAGCAVVGPAGTVQRARTLIAEAEFDAALLDVNIAGEPVDELATALTHKQCPFAFVSGYGRDSLPLGFREAILLGKPFTPDQLLATVTALLGERPNVVPLRQMKR
jgi:PAS domain S-box-containing protein